MLDTGMFALTNLIVFEANIAAVATLLATLAPFIIVKGIADRFTKMVNLAKGKLAPASTVTRDGSL